ncbi:MAG: hypothetical protein C4570_05085 [Ammonifex sp.]|jgi:hypothetical protein|nr:MAG: hypothetical protein C4570_05085 [Ammonifex sp.]
MENFEVKQISFLWGSLGLCFIPDAKLFLCDLSKTLLSGKTIHRILNFGFSVTTEGKIRKEFLSLQITITDSKPEVSFEISFPFDNIWALPRFLKMKDVLLVADSATWSMLLSGNEATPLELIKNSFSIKDGLGEAFHEFCHWLKYSKTCPLADSTRNRLRDTLFPR